MKIKSNAEKDFDLASSTGQSVFILKAVENCDCHDENDLFNSEPNPHCKKCFGTGKERLIIKTANMRFDYGTSKNMAVGNENITENFEDTTYFYMPEVYQTVNNTDVIVVPTNPIRFYEVENTLPNVYKDFRFFEVIGKKIPYMNLKLSDING
ncbi:MAG: hypothetical protein ACRC0G_03175 [Fusobacteriaceae bacterium]